jgi:hypothetical protein
MQDMTQEEINAVSGARISADAMYGGALSVSGGLLALGLTVTAPVWGTAALLGGSIVASGLAIYYLW